MTAPGFSVRSLIGAVIGIFAELVLPGRQRISVLVTVIIGTRPRSRDVAGPASVSKRRAGSTGSELIPDRAPGD
jgi:hypothetical protein